MTMEQQLGFIENGFEISPSLILANKELVVDFFGDNREWYRMLIQGGETYTKTSLDSNEDFDKDLGVGNSADAEVDKPPLNPENITDNRAESVSKFFDEVPGAKDAFMEYYRFYSKK